MTSLAIKTWDERSVHTARLLLIAFPVVLMLSTSATVALEAVIYILFVASPSLRSRLLHALRSPESIALLAFGVILLFGMLYGDAPWEARWRALAGWRKLLLFPMAVALFANEISKRTFIKVFFGFCIVVALLSFLFDGLGIDITPRLSAGVVVHNYITQGLLLTMGAAIAAAALLRPQVFSGDPFLGNRPVMGAALLAFLINIAFVIIGRSGYLAVLVAMMVVVATLAPVALRTRIVTAIGVLLVVAMMIAVSERARTRIALAIEEIRTAESAPQITSVGVRFVMWQNTLSMIEKNPILGVGTGSFMEGYRREVAGRTSPNQTPTNDPHNQFLRILAEHGLLGLAAFGAFLVLCLAAPAPTPYRQLAATGLIAWCATSLFSSHFSTFVEGRLIFLWLGVMLAGARPQLST
ncbi:MAG TPA: O-antigen ligase family protein [Xanthobacteraceae bacterium]|nr:O-antigen ligase family protein [Xanthobacteraceae bacterium]